MKLWIKLILPLVLIFSACSEEKRAVPENLMTKQDLAAVIADVQLVESIINVRTDDEMLQADTLDLYRDIFEAHNVDKRKFEESMDYYAGNPEEMEEIYSDVIILLSEKLASFEGVEESTEKKEKN